MEENKNKKRHVKHKRNKSLSPNISRSLDSSYPTLNDDDDFDDAIDLVHEGVVKNNAIYHSTTKKQ